MTKNIIKRLMLTAATVSMALLSQAVTGTAQAAILGGSGTCSKVSFTYIDCAGAFAGNDKGAQGTGLSNLNSLFGGEWTLAGDNEDGLVSFLTGGTNSKSGQAKTTLKGFGAIAVKAGNSYSLYTLAELSQFSWDTAGVTPVGKKGNIPELSHLTVYTRKPNNPEPRDIPEPGMLLGLVGLAGAGLTVKKQPLSNQA